MYSIKNDLIKGKRGIILGVANDRSLAWGIASAIFENGGESIITYAAESLQKRVKPLADNINAEILLCDVSSEQSLDDMVQFVKEKYGSIDFIVHAIAFAEKSTLQGSYLGKITEDNFVDAMKISCYSLTKIIQKTMGILNKGASILTLTYHGSRVYIPNYNVMGLCKAALEASVRYLAVDLADNGIRINAISAAPARTLASSGVGNFYNMYAWYEQNVPMKIDNIGKSSGDMASFLISDMASAITGQIIYVDGGVSIVGMSKDLLKKS